MADGLGDAPSGFYAALGVKFAAEADEMKKAYRRQSLKYHPDRNPSEEAKSSFQLVNNAWSCLSEPARRLEYDGVFRMRCVLEQGQLSAAALRERPLDLVYMFAVTVRKSLAGGGGLGLREENVLIFNLEAARLERWRGGDVVDSRPLAALRGVRDGDGDAAGSLRLLLGEEGGKETSLALSARSAADAAAITRLVTRLVTALTAGGLRLREDDSDMPPPAVMSGWLTMRAAAPTSKVGVGALQASLPSSGALSRPSRIFALLGRSKLLVFTDRTCATLKQLLTLEAGTLELKHARGDEAFVLSIGKFKLSLTADSAFVAGQWASAITAGLMQKGLFIDDEIEDAPPTEAGAASGGGGGRARGRSGSGSGGSPKTARDSPPATDPWSPPRAGDAVHARRSGAGAAAAAAAAQHRRVPSGDLLGGIAGHAPAAADAALARDLDALYAQPAAELDAALASAAEPAPAPSRPTAATAATPAAAAPAFVPFKAAKAACCPLNPLCSKEPGHAGACKIDWSRAAAPPVVSIAAATQPAAAAPPPAAPPPSAPPAHRRQPSEPSLLDFDELAPPPPPPGGGSSVFDDDFMMQMLGGGAASSPPAASPLAGGPPLAAAAATSATAAAAEVLSLRLEKKGGAVGAALRADGSGAVVVAEVSAGGAAAAAGLRAGDVLLQVGGMSVHSADVARSWLEQAAALGSPAAAAVVLVRRARASPSPSPPLPHSDPLAAAGGAASAGEVWAPTVPFAEGVGATQLTAEWQMPAWASAEEVSHYELQWLRYGAGERWVSTDGARRLGQRRATISSLQPGAAYWVRVRAAARDGRLSEFSQSVAPALTAPPAPEAFPIDGGVVHVIFGAAECAAHHELQWRPHAQAGQPDDAGWEGSAGSARLSGTTVAKRNLAGGVRWQFRARAFTDEGLPSPWSPASAPVLAGDPIAHFEEVQRERERERDRAAQPAAAAGGGGGGGGGEEGLVAQLRELGLSRDEALGALRATAGGGGADSGVPESVRVAAAADHFFSAPPTADHFQAPSLEEAQRARPSDDVSRLLDL